MSRKPRRPSPITIGDRPRYTVRPLGDATEEGYRWRLEWYTGRDDDSGRTSTLHTAALGRHATGEQAQAAALALLSSGKIERVVVAPTSVATLGVLLRAYLASVESDPARPKSTRMVYRSHVARLLGRLGDIPTNPPPVADVLDRYRRSCLGDGFAPATVQLDLTILRAAWTWARDRHHVPDRPLPRVVVEVPRNERYVPPVADVVAVLLRLEAMATTGGVPAWAPLYARLLWATGARRSEIARLAPEDVRLHPERDAAPFAVLHLGRHEGGRKTGNRRVPVVDRETAEILAAWMEATPTTEGGTVWGRAARTVEDIHEYLTAACQAQKVPTFSPQGIRKATTNALFDAGADPAIEAVTLGHTEATASAHYRQPRAEAITAAMTRAGMGAVPRPDPGKVVEFKR